MVYLILGTLIAVFVITARETAAVTGALGSLAEVSETIDQVNRTGAVLVNGKRWPARSANGARIPTGTQVLITSAGAKMRVQPVKKERTEAAK